MYTLTMKPNYRKISGLLYGACIEDVNHELYGGIWSQMIFGESFAEPAKEVGGCSGMWELTIKGTARGNVPVATEDCYIGSQSQRIEFLSGIGSVGINNMGLNRSGMYFASNKEYQGYIYARADQPIQVYAMLENEDGSQCYGEASFVVNGDWQKYSFCLLTDGEDYKGRFTLEIREQGRLEVGYVYLEPGEWGRYKGLPVRRDVGEMLEKQGIGVLRMGGCMTNAPEYRWKKMIGLREERGGYKGWWYPYASYGFGIVEFLNLCEALGVEAVPDFLCDESAQDMEDFAHFAYGTDSADPWVRMRQEMGHREPYDLKYIQIGNENKINREFGAHFNEIANRIWAVNPKVTLIVGDFIYNEVIEDPWNFGGSEAKITSLEGHKMILDNAEAQGRTVWFDIHFWSETGRHPYDSFEPALSFYKALKQICPLADVGLCVLELNANCHHFERGLCNATAIQFAEKYSDIIHMMCSANCLQVQDHNDNGWNQGLLFMNNHSTWYQPAAYIDRMFRDAHLPLSMNVEGVECGPDLYVTAAADETGKTICVKIMNKTGKSQEFQIPGEKIRVREYVDVLETVNTAEDPERSKPGEMVDGGNLVEVSGYSMTIVMVETI